MCFFDLKRKIEGFLTSTIYARRRPADSRLDPSKTLAEQFNLLRVVDNQDYPAFFEMHGRLYRISIEPKDDPGK